MSVSDSQTLGKRSACDHCRTQKLRCLRVDKRPTDSCIRCVRSQVECITSSSKRPGRPARNSTDASRQHTDPVSNTHNKAKASPQTVDIPIGNVEDWFNFGSLDANEEISSVCWPSVDLGDVYTHDFALSGGGNEFTIPSISDPANGSSNSASLNEPTEIDMREHSPSLQSEHGHSGMLQILDHQPSTKNYDHGLRLSVLYHDLSKQLFSLKSMLWDMTEVMQVTCIHETNVQSSLESNPLASITKKSAEFAEILWSFQSSMANEGSNTTTDAGQLSSINPRLSMAHLLTTISCHILIISIYDSIFCHFIDQYLHNPSAVSIVMQSAPKLSLGGVAVPPWPNMLGHLLLRLTESQLRPIELLLGLPDEFCISLNRNSGSKGKRKGLFSGQSGQLLFTALMQIESEKATKENGGMGVIESLGEKTRRVKGGLE